jgi:S1-C subfamily serine protease
LEVLRSSVSVRCLHSEPPEGAGSGTILHRFGRTYVLTAYHVIDCNIKARTNASDRVYVDIYKGTNVWKAYYVQGSEEHDLALLRVEGTDLIGESARFFSPDVLPMVGMKVLTAGNIHGMMQDSYSEGILAGLYRTSPLSGPTMYLDQTTAVIYSGSSGSGVFTADGRYVGMVVQMMSPSVNLIVPVRRMMEWADEDDLLWLFLCE